MPNDECLARYAYRLRKLGPEYFAELDGAYLSTFDVYSLLPMTNGKLHVGQGMSTCHAIVLARVAYEKGALIKGVISERQTNGHYICARPPDAKVVYVGPRNFFTGHIQSPWMLIPFDRALKRPANHHVDRTNTCGSKSPASVNASSSSS